MAPLKNVLIIGAGGVGAVTAHKCAQNNDRLGDVWLASRTVAKCDAIAGEIHARGNLAVPDGRLEVRALDAKDVEATRALIREAQASIVLNVGSPHINLPVMEACLGEGAHYLDTAVHEGEGEMNLPPPWYANYEWKLRGRFAAAELTAILGIGFDPGVVNAFTAHVAKHVLDSIRTVDIMDVNGGDHGRYFATNFDPETNLREIMEDVVYWENGDWKTIPCHSRSRAYDFPELGEFKLYSMGHDEIHSLAVNVDAERIEFWMGFSDRYIEVFTVLKNLGLLSPDAVNVEGQNVVPIKLVKALLPDPATLAKGYSGKVCIGCEVTGTKDGRDRTVFIYSTKAHEDCYGDVGSQAISYTTGVPAVTAALLIANGDWRANRMVNVEELDPDPFLAEMPKLGIGWSMIDSWE